MKKVISSIPSITFFCSLLLLLLHFSPVQSDADLISETCKQTPYYSLCVSSLNSDPRSQTADVAGLALIMVNVVEAKSALTLNHIKHLLRNNPGVLMQRPLASCASRYDAVLALDIPEAKEALKKGDPKFAEDGVNDAALEANSCEGSFHGNSPLASLNKAMHDVSVVTSSIIRLLL